MDRNVTATLLLAGVGVLAVAGLTAAFDGNEATSTTPVVAQSAPEEHDHAAGQGLGQGQGTGNGHGNGTGQGANGSGTHGQGGNGQGNGTGQGANGSGTHGEGTEHESHAEDIPAAVPGATITTKVAKELAFMVEEEKLARDVYDLAKVAHPDARVFTNISRSESSHMSDLKVLLKRYGVTDPTADNDPGKFDDKSLQKLYDDLAERVDDSRQAAAQVGVDVEVKDIADLKKAMKLDAPADVKAVLGNLLAGSERHLVAFQRNGGMIAKA